MSCINIQNKPLKLECSNYAPRQSNYAFADGICYKDGEKHGKIVHLDDKLITIEVDNGNRYMKDQKVNFHLIPTWKIKS